MSNDDTKVNYPWAPSSHMKNRCSWATSPPIYVEYHDTEWGVPLYDDAKLFEFLILEGMQAGLSWLIVLNKRENFRKAFDGFDPKKVAKYDENKIAELLQNAGIIRNKAKVRAAVTNAQAFLDIQEEFGSFSKYMWGFVDGQPVINRWKELSDIPATSPIAEELSLDLKKRGFKFVGPTVVYAHMQATGMVNDHLVDCLRWEEVQKKV